MKAYVRFGGALIGVALAVTGAVVQAQNATQYSYYDQEDSTSDTVASFNAIMANGDGVYSDDTCTGGGCYGDYGCCGDCGGCGDCGCYCGDSCGSGGGCCLGSGSGSGRGGLFDCGANRYCGGQFFFEAEYIYARAKFSEALAFVETDLSNINMPTQTFTNLDFDYQSTYGFYGGYRLACCGAECRIGFRRMQSDAFIEAPDGADIPLEVVPFPTGGRVPISASVDRNTYDFEMRKTIPLGGPVCCECDCGDCCGCGDSCGCGDCCGCDDCCCCVCPAWDITWSGGLRYADVEWGRQFTTIDNLDVIQTDASTRMQFDGWGARFGMEGRRYFGCQGMFSLFLRGDISLLCGDVDLVTTREQPPTTPGVVEVQRFSNKNIIPVTEIEFGGTMHVTSNARISAGYFFEAWHDLGMRQDFQLTGISLPVGGYDDANILGFEGLFVRGEVAY